MRTQTIVAKGRVAVPSLAHTQSKYVILLQHTELSGAATVRSSVTIVRKGSEREMEGRGTTGTGAGILRGGMQGDR